MASRTPAVVATAILALPLVVAASPAAAADEPAPKLANIRICDPTGCYVAWRVVDSDGDGVCDADELVVAGTDPFDRHSYPPLEVTIELAAGRRLPSFENGLGAFIAFPAELIELREKYTNFPSVGGFAMPARESTLTRLGIDLSQFEALKLSVQRDGFAVGLGSVAKNTDGIPTTMVSPFEGRIVIYERGVPGRSPAAYGGVKGSENLYLWDDADYRLFYNDGSHDDVTLTPGGTSAQHTNPDGSKGNTTNTHRSDYVADGVRYIKDSTSVFSPDGKLLSTTTSETLDHDGQADSYTKTTQYVYDEDGNLVGTLTTETVVHQDGDHVRGGQTVTACDQDGQHCTSVTVTYDSDDPPHSDDESDHGYVNPDYADDTVVTFELMDGITRVLGSNITVVPDWTPPYTEGTIPEHPLSGVMYVDDIAGVYSMTISEPRITTAQPERRPGLPNPMEGAPPPKVGGCDGLC